MESWRTYDVRTQIGREVMATVSAATRVTKNQRIDLRTSDRQQDVLRRAAAATDSTLSEFILDSAVERAEKILADRRWFTVNEDQWTAFTALLDAPLPATDRFEALVRRPSPFSDH